MHVYIVRIGQRHLALLPRNCVTSKQCFFLYGPELFTFRGGMCAVTGEFVRNFVPVRGNGTNKQKRTEIKTFQNRRWIRDGEKTTKSIRTGRERDQLMPGKLPRKSGVPKIATGGFCYSACDISAGPQKKKEFAPYDNRNAMYSLSWLNPGQIFQYGYLVPFNQLSLTLPAAGIAK